MPKLLLLMTALCLTACISVKDYGMRWDQATLDPQVAGRWTKIAVPAPKEKPAKEQLAFTAKNGLYQVNATKNGVIDPDFKSNQPVKTLVIGVYRFMANKAATASKAGEMVRYSIGSDGLTLQTLRMQQIRQWLEREHPRQTGLTAGDYTLEVAMLDDATAITIAAIPDTAEYWQVAQRYKKAP